MANDARARSLCRAAAMLTLLQISGMAAWSKTQLQGPADAVAPGTIPLLQQSQPPSSQKAPGGSLPQQQGQSSTGGNPQRSERILQLTRWALSEKTRAASAGENAAAAGLTPGQASWLLGLIYLHGQGVPLNPAQAEFWFKRAWTLHERVASAGLAWCALDGCSGPANPSTARQWLHALRAVQPARALYLEWLLVQQLAPVELASTPRLATKTDADVQLRQAASQGDVQALAALGRHYFSQHRFNDALKAFSAAASRSPAAAGNVELVKARMAVEAAPAPPAARTDTRTLPDAETIYLQARRLHRGEGVPANYTEAIRLYLLADRMGHPPARKMLSLIYSRPLVSGDVDIGWMRQLADLDITLPSPRVMQPSQGLILHEDITPLMDLLPPAWRS